MPGNHSLYNNAVFTGVHVHGGVNSVNARER